MSAEQTSNYKKPIRYWGITATTLSVVAGGPIGVGMAAVAGVITVANELRSKEVKPERVVRIPNFRVIKEIKKGEKKKK